MTAFNTGMIVATPNALANIPARAMSEAIHRHLRNDWGDCVPEDAKANDEALKTGERLFSVYHHDNIKFWIITEADRSSTCILLPEDY